MELNTKNSLRRLTGFIRGASKSSKEKAKRVAHRASISLSFKEATRRASHFFFQHIQRRDREICKCSHGRIRRRGAATDKAFPQYIRRRDTTFAKGFFPPIRRRGAEKMQRVLTEESNHLLVFHSRLLAMIEPQEQCKPYQCPSTSSITQSLYSECPDASATHHHDSSVHYDGSTCIYARRNCLSSMVKHYFDAEKQLKQSWLEATKTAISIDHARMYRSETGQSIQQAYENVLGVDFYDRRQAFLSNVGAHLKLFERSIRPGRAPPPSIQSVVTSSRGHTENILIYYYADPVLFVQLSPVLSSMAKDIHLLEILRNDNNPEEYTDRSILDDFSFTTTTENLNEAWSFLKGQQSGGNRWSGCGLPYEMYKAKHLDGSGKLAV